MSEKTGTDQDAAAAIKKSIQSYLHQVTTERDLEETADFYTEDARLIGPDTDLDRLGIIDSIRAVFESGVEVQVGRRTIELFVHGDAAYEIAQAKDTFVNPDGTLNTVQNNLFSRWVRDTDDKWRFARVLLSPQTVD